jgi:hypothetical protein
LPAVDREAALKVSDAFMLDLVNDRVQDAVAKFEPAFLTAQKPAEAVSAVRSLFDYCGRPLNSKLKHEEVGIKVYLDGAKKTTHQFVYGAKTTQHPEGKCFFAVTLVSAPDRPQVTNFGPLRLLQGELPEWAK